MVEGGWKESERNEKGFKNKWSEAYLSLRRRGKGKFLEAVNGTASPGETLQDLKEGGGKVTQKPHELLLSFNERAGKG